MAGKICSLVVVIASLFVGLFLAIAVTLTVPQPTLANPGVLYAAPTVQGSGNCSSWANACTLQTALTSAVSGDEIWVKAGVHKPGAAGDRTATFTLENGVALYGGFAGTETSRDQRNWAANPTILSGDIDNNDTNTDGNYIAETWNDIQGSNSYHVVTGSGTDNTAVLDGFIITAGQAGESYSPHQDGGGMYNSGGSPTLTNVTFSGNSATYEGGGMYNQNSNSTLTNVTFSGNSALYGGGVFGHNSNLILTDVTFSGNRATDAGGGLNNWSASNLMLTNVTFSGNSALYGGGMFNNYGGSPTLTNVTFTSNSATQQGGGMYNINNSSSTLTNVTFSGNSATQQGGGMYNYGSSPTLMNVTFSGNSATDGGGMYNTDNSSPTLTNVTFSGNSADYGGGMYNYNYNNYNSSPTLTNVTFSGNQANYNGGGMLNNNNSPTLTNMTFSGNSANTYGGGMYNYGNSNPTLMNVILWGNTASNGASIYNDGGTANIFYSDIQGCGGSGSWNSACGTDQGGNIDTDPFFVDADGPDDTYGTADDNLRLQLTSPAIDAGDNAAVPAGVTTDLDGNPRFVDIPTVPNTGNGTPPIVDMGAYEAQGIGADADLGLGMSYELYRVSSITFTVVVSNAGPSAADGAVVSNTIFADLTGTNENCVVSGGGSCSLSGTGSMTVTTFPVGSVATYTLHGTLVNWSFFENTATVSPPAGVTDPNPGNNSATISRYVLFLTLIYKNYTAP